MKVELSGEAKVAVARIDAWWRSNRPAAPGLFLDELEQALNTLEGARLDGLAETASRR